MAEHETIAALAAQIDDLRKEFSEFKADALLRLKKLSDRLTRAVNAGKTSPPFAPYWADLDDTEREAGINALRDWVDGFLRKEYEDWAPPLCWHRHPAAVWELSTLHAEWKRVYADPENRSLEGAQWWHERWLPGVRSRVWAGERSALYGCQIVCKLDKH